MKREAANRLIRNTGIAAISLEIQKQTGCTAAESLVAAAIAFESCSPREKREPVIGRHGECLLILCVTNPSFHEDWSDHSQGRERCDELNRNLAHPAYFIA